MTDRTPCQTFTKTILVLVVAAVVVRTKQKELNSRQWRPYATVGGLTQNHWYATVDTHWKGFKCRR